MQSTMTEHAHSSAAETSCASCHMPKLQGSPTTGSSADTHASHRFDSAHDPAFVRSSLLVTAKRVSPTSIEVRLDLVDTGHVVPTGDLFRRLLVEAYVGDSKKPLSRDFRFLARHFVYETQIPGSVARVVRLDDRVGADGESESRVVLTLGGAEEREIAWRVVYQRVQSLGAGASAELDAVIDGKIEIAHGAAPP